MSFLFGKKKNKDYKTHEDLHKALRACGVLEDLNLMIFYDFSKSNEWTGKHSFDGKHLHTISQFPNPYQQATNCLKLLLKADNDGRYPIYSYGSARANMMENNLEFLGICRNIGDINNVYCRESSRARMNDEMAGPTCLQYILNETIRVYEATKEF